MCKKSKDFVDHLLLHCETTNALWSSIFGLYLWVKVGHAPTESAGWNFSKCSSVEDVLINVVYLEREMIIILKIVRERWK